MKDLTEERFTKIVALNLVLVATLLLQVNACDQKFEGFGIFLGSNAHFGRSKPGTEAKVLEVVYNFLGIRYFRTSYEEHFSPEPDKYEINCTESDPFTCSWINVHRYISTLPDAKVFASIWSPPHYMKNQYYQLKRENEPAYFHFIKNITELLKSDYNIEIERVSPVNEPENVFAPWDHTNMTPDQLCRIIHSYNDPLISICPENSYFWISKLFYNFQSINNTLNCSAYCDIMATHAYALNLDFGSNNTFLAYYDLKAYDRETSNPIWMTEVSSTYRNADESQMQEAMDLATNIINFLGKICIQRYYFWYAYTLGYSGESLIWGDDDGNLVFPKKFFVYKSFVNASNTINGAVDVNICDTESTHTPIVRIVENLDCLQFGTEDRMLVNRDVESRQLIDQSECKSLCCTTEADDLTCTTNSTLRNTIPARSVCHCVLNTPSLLQNNIL